MRSIWTGPSLDEYTDEEIESCWWTPEETDFFRADCKHIIQEVTRAPIKLRNDSYRHAKMISECFSQSACEAVLTNPKYYTSQLKTWSVTCHGRRGLEKYISRMQRVERTKQVQHARALVLEMTRSGANSRESSVYARMVGDADQHTACSSKRVSFAAI
jgi:hypothetical protein